MRRHLRVAGIGRSIQEEEEEGLPADGGMLGLLAQIYTGSLGQLVGAHVGYFHELIQVIQVQWRRSGGGTGQQKKSEGEGDILVGMRRYGSSEHRCRRMTQVVMCCLFSVVACLCWRSGMAARTGIGHAACRKS